jgi:hypothetical protein
MRLRFLAALGATSGVCAALGAGRAVFTATAVAGCCRFGVGSAFAGRAAGRHQYSSGKNRRQNHHRFHIVLPLVVFGCASINSIRARPWQIAFTKLFCGGIGGPDFLQIFRGVFVEVGLAHRTAEFDFLAFIFKDVRLAHVSTQLVAGNRARRQQVRLDGSGGVRALCTAGRGEGNHQRGQNHSRNQF